MKIKKSLALLLSLAMIICLMPTSAFASSSNTVAAVPTVAASEKMSATDLYLEVKDVAGWKNDTAQKIKLTLENAEWVTVPTALSDVLTVSTDAEGVTFTTEFVSADENSIEFSFTPSANIAKGKYIQLTLADKTIKSGSEAGAVKVAIDGLDSKVSSSTLTIATVATSTTTATVNGKVKTFPRGEVTGADLGTTIEIRETAVNSLVKDSRQEIKLTLPKGVTWDINETLFSGDLAQVTDKKLSDDNRALTVTFTVTGSDTVRNVMTIKPGINISRDTAEGEIAVSLVGLSGKLGTEDKATVSDATDLVIAQYGNESVAVSTVEEVPTIISGYVLNAKDKNFTISVTLKENMAKALAAGRYVDFDLPEEVQICGQIKAKVNSGTKTVANNCIEVEGTTGNLVGTGTPIVGINKDTSGFAFLVPQPNGTVVANNDWSSAKGNEITFEIPVTVEAGYTGDIKLAVSGAKAGVEATDLIVAKAEAPITVETKTTDVKNGVQTQVVSDITIKENYVGYLDDTAKSNEIVLDIDTLGLSRGMVFESFDSIKVTDGNMELGKCSINDNEQIIIPIKHASTKVSTIEIKGVTVALNRTLPEGGYDLLVSGTPVVDNGAYNDGDFSDTAVTVEDYVKIVTPADATTTKIDAQFVIGQASYTDNGKSVAMDAAPYIDSNSRTMVPIRYIANACGVSDNNIVWNGATQTATMSGANTVVRIKVGSSTITTSTGTITMDTVAVNKDGRIYVPLRFIANAFGADVAWNQATMTASIMK